MTAPQGPPQGHNATPGAQPLPQQPINATQQVNPPHQIQFSGAGNQIVAGAPPHGVRPQMMRMAGPGVPAQGILAPNTPGFAPRMQRPGPPHWQQQQHPLPPKHPQEITLQQRGAPQPSGPILSTGPSPMGAGSGPLPVAGPSGGGAHPAFVRQDSTPPPPPAALNMTPPPQPPDNPQTEEDRQKVMRYETWLTQQENDINKRLKYYEMEIAKIRKQKKVRVT